LKDTNVTKISAENSERNENIQHLTGACRAVSSVDCRGGPPMPYYEYEPQSVLENSS